jgi:selenocysteine lyase/cysteine desulfurase
MSPSLKAVTQSGIDYLKKKARPYEIQPEDFFTNSDKLRGLFAKLINSNDKESIALIPSVSYGMANVVKNFRPNRGKDIIVLEGQFPSNVYPWMDYAKENNLKIKSIKFDQNGNERLISAINDETAVVALPHVHWATGNTVDLEGVRQKIGANDTYLIVDGTQSVGAMPFDVSVIKPDALICAGYKWLLGPYQLGYAYYNTRFDQGTPIEQNWITRKDSHKFENLVNYTEEYQPKATRYDVGERSNFINVAMGIEAIKQLLTLTPEGITDYCENLISPYLAQWESMGYSIVDKSHRSSHLFSIHLHAGIDRLKLSQKLKDNNVYLSLRGDYLRISPNVYNEASDLDALTRSLEF